MEASEARDELLRLLERERGDGAALSAEELERLLVLTARGGFVREPDDACAHVLPFRGGGSHPTQYDLEWEGHSYYLRWRYGFSIDVDDVTVLECDLDTTTTNDWTFRETTVMLSIISEAIREGRSLGELKFPDEEGFRAHPMYVVGKSPFYCFPEEFLREHGLQDAGLLLEVRDFAPWYELWHRRNVMRGIPSEPPGAPRCDCGVAGLSCWTLGCDRRPRDEAK